MWSGSCWQMAIQGGKGLAYNLHYTLTFSTKPRKMASKGPFCGVFRCRNLSHK